MDFEKYFDEAKIKGRYQRAVASETAKALTQFCQQEPEFKQAVEQSDKSFQECLDEVCKGIIKSISDIEVYRRAVKFYFSTAEIHFDMRIDLCGDNGYQAPPITRSDTASLSLSLDALLDF